MSLNYKGDEKYPNESKFINEMYEDGNLWKFNSDKFNHFLNNSNYEEPIIVVKQKFLDRSKKLYLKI